MPKDKKIHIIAILLSMLVVVAMIFMMRIGTHKGVDEDLFEAPRAHKTTQSVDIALIVIDTLRADYLATWGCEHNTAPFLNKLMSDSVVFKNAIAPAPWTVPAMNSLITGLYPRQHGMVRGQERQSAHPVLPEDLKTLPEYLKQNGYQTFGISTNYHVTKRFGFGQGFDHFIGEHFNFLPYTNMALHSLGPFIEQSDKYFIWLHYFDPHQPYLTRHPWFGEYNDSKFASYREILTDIAYSLYRNKVGLAPHEGIALRDLDKVQRFISLGILDPVVAKLFNFFRKHPHLLDDDYRKFLKAAYKSDISATDRAIEQALNSMHIDDDTMIIIVADHGEELFDHGNLGHHTGTLYQELIHIPFVIRFPQNKYGGLVVDNPVSLIDVLPTVLDYTGQKVPSGLAGKSLMPIIGGEKTSPRYIFSELNDSSGHIEAVIDYPWKCIYSFHMDTYEIYQLEQDPIEGINLSVNHPEKIKWCQNALDKWRNAYPIRKQNVQSIPLSPSDIERLKALGYMQHH